MGLMSLMQCIYNEFNEIKVHTGGMESARVFHVKRFLTFTTFVFKIMNRLTFKTYE